MTAMNKLLVNELERRVLELEAVAPPYGDRHAMWAHSAKLRNARLAYARSLGRHTSAEWDAIVAETGGNCVRCGGKPERICKGHITPLAWGGSDAADNLQPLCRYCAPAASREGIDWLAAWRETNGNGAKGT